MRPFAAICTAVAVGLHWILLQCVAWLSMAVIYTEQEGSLAEGLAMTFDGNHPCAMCHAISAAKKADGGDQPAVPSTQPDAKLVQCIGERNGIFVLRRPSGSFGRSPRVVGRGVEVFSEGPDRPPRLA